MRTLLIAMVLAAAPAAAAAQDAPAPVGVDVTELTVTGGGGVQTMVVHDALSTLDDVTLRCYANAQAQAPKLAGTIAIRFRLDARGAATNIAVTGVPSVNACLIAAIKAASFAGPAKGPIEIREKVSLRVLAPSVGILGSTEQGGAFASLTGTGDLTSGLDDNNIYGGLIGNETGEMAGGFGFGKSGLGPDGGGTGWGSIGTGRNGQHGGSGLKGQTAIPTVSLGQPSARGELDKAIIRRYIKRNLQRLQYCYEKQLLTVPRLAGTVTAKFTIGLDGKVTDSTASGIANVDVHTCIASVIKAIEFPKPKTSEVVVSYPFVFHTDDDHKP
jgi:hypothetical protein